MKNPFQLRVHLGAGWGVDMTGAGMKWALAHLAHPGAGRGGEHTEGRGENAEIHCSLAKQTTHNYQ